MLIGIAQAVSASMQYLIMSLSGGQSSVVQVSQLDIPANIRPIKHIINMNIQRMYCPMICQRRKKKEKKNEIVMNHFMNNFGRNKRKSAFEHAQNAQIQIILHMRKASSGPLLSISTFCSIQWVS